MPIRKQITKFRKDVIRNVGTQFHLRGDVRENKFNNNQNAFVQGSVCGIEIPAYLIQPRYKINSKEWLEKLHATIHAATYRTIRRGLQTRLHEPEKENPKYLPIIQVFRTEHGQKSNDTRFNQDFKPYRTMYEKGSVHGKAKETFRESNLSRNKEFNDTKLFDVFLTKKEYIDLINGIKEDLRKANSNFSFQELNRSFFFDSNDPNYKQKIRLFHEITKFKRGIAFLDETTPSSIGEYIFYLRLSRLMTNKLVRKAIEYVEKQKAKNQS